MYPCQNLNSSQGFLLFYLWTLYQSYLQDLLYFCPLKNTEKSQRYLKAAELLWRAVINCFIRPNFISNEGKTPSSGWGSPLELTLDIVFPQRDIGPLLPVVVCCTIFFPQVEQWSIFVILFQIKEAFYEDFSTVVAGQWRWLFELYLESTVAVPVFKIKKSVLQRRSQIWITFYAVIRINCCHTF